MSGALYYEVRAGALGTVRRLLRIRFQERTSQMSTSTVNIDVTPEERQVRIDLAALYRLVALHGWDDLVFTHLTARVPGPDEHFLINPYGLMFDEVTASSLVKVDLSGNKVSETTHQINPAGFTIHSAVHEARPDAACVMHLHTKAGVAVSAQADGLLPISQQATVVLPSLAYHDYEGIALDPDERTRLQADLGDKSFMILRNHGLLTAGASIPDAFLAMYILQAACEVQIMAQAGGSALIRVSDDIIANTGRMVAKVTHGLGGKLAWPALIRQIDRVDASYRE